MTRICIMKLEELREMVKKIHHVNVAYDNKLFRYIVQDKMTTDSDAGGARGIVSRIEREVTTNIAQFINHHPEVRNGHTIYVQVDGALMCDNKNRLESNARIVVSEEKLSSFEQS